MKGDNQSKENNFNGNVDIHYEGNVFRRSIR